jgi:hypothetical protein
MDGRLIATRAFFPHSFETVVRQKSRWVLGIALLGWDRVGWGGGLSESWMRARDRRGPLTALVLLVGYALVLLTGIMGAMVATGVADPVPLTPLLKVVLIANAFAFAWRIAMRFAFTAREYGVREGLWAVARVPLANVIAIISGRPARSPGARRCGTRQTMMPIRPSPACCQRCSRERASAPGLTLARRPAGDAGAAADRLERRASGAVGEPLRCACVTPRCAGPVLTAGAARPAGRAASAGGGGGGGTTGSAGWGALFAAGCWRRRGAGSGAVAGRIAVARHGPARGSE